MNTNYSLILITLFITLLSPVTQANPYNLTYFLDNPKDIEEQLDICNIQIWKAKDSGNLANVKAAKNNPACLAAKKAKEQIKESKISQSKKAYDARQKAWKLLTQETKGLAKQHTLKVLQAKKQSCDDTPHPVLYSSGSECGKITTAIRERKKIDKVEAISNYRTRSGKMSEKERFTLLATPNECEKKHGREPCQDIRQSQYLDKRAYEKTFRKNHKIAQATVAKCKPAFFKALAKARSINNDGDRSRAESAVINLRKPPFNNPLACKTAASTLRTSFGMMAYEK